MRRSASLLPGRKSKNAMPFQAVPNTVQCDILFLLFGQICEMVVHVEVPAGVDAPTIQDCANEVGNWVEDTLLPALSQDITFLRVEAKNLSIEAGGEAVYNAATGTTGGGAVGSEAGNVAFCVSLKTASSGRSFRGRKYVPGIATSQRVGNTVLPAYGQALADAFNTLITVLEGFSKALVIVSRIADGVERLTAVTTPVTSAVATNFDLDSQRRRLNGRGT